MWIDHTTNERNDEMSEAMVVRDNGSGALAEANSVSDIVNQVTLIQQVMKATMKDKEHYGVVPGCGDKPTLLQPGAQKLALTFRLAPRYHVETGNLERGHREYSVRCELFNVNGQFVGEGVGSCCTMESKFRYRNENTGKEVPKAYWDSKDVNLLGGADYMPRKQRDFKTGATKWMIFHQVEHPNPADYYNTCLKMGKKRAFVDAILTRTAASDIFSQDLEDLKENFDVHTAEPEMKQADAQVVDEPPKTTVPSNVTDQECGECVVHFGKTMKDKRLNEIQAEAVAWLVEKWEVKPYNGKISAKDTNLKECAVRYLRYLKALKVEQPKEEEVKP
jgi:hypothetical protein